MEFGQQFYPDLFHELCSVRKIHMCFALKMGLFYYFFLLPEFDYLVSILIFHLLNIYYSKHVGPQKLKLQFWTFMEVQLVF